MNITNIITAGALVISLASIGLSILNIRMQYRDHPELSWSADESLRNDCEVGFNASVIYHHEKRVADGMPIIAGEETYRRVKSACDQIGARPKRT